jgi:hypothetical protein
MHFLTNEGGLKDSSKICAGEKIMVFIHILAGHSNAQTKERWQHSGSTISQVFHEVKRSMLKVKQILLQPPSSHDSLSRHASS